MGMNEIEKLRAEVKRLQNVATLNADDENGVLVCSACGGVVAPSAEGSE